MPTGRVQLGALSATGNQTGEVQMAIEIKDVLIPRKRVQEITSLGRTRLWEMIRQKKFVAPIATGARSRAWSLRAVNAWVEQQIAAGQGSAA